MHLSDQTHSSRETLFIPAFASFYDQLAQPLAWVVLRVAVGGMLMVEGWPKIMAPLAQTGFVESLGFYPGWLWSPLLAVLQVCGGFFIAAGLFTRPFALANGIMLLVTYWFHVTHPYGDAFLTEAGIAAIAAGSDLFTPAAVARLADGGAKFLEQVQTKAELASLFWAGGELLFAAFGGGYLSLDRLMMRRQF